MGRKAGMGKFIVLILLIIVPVTYGKQRISDTLEVTKVVKADSVFVTKGISTGGDLVGTKSAGLTLRTNTVDGADNKCLLLFGGGAIGTSRGAEIGLYGNEYASPLSGALVLEAGTGDGTTSGAVYVNPRMYFGTRPVDNGYQLKVDSLKAPILQGNVTTRGTHSADTFKGLWSNFTYNKNVPSLRTWTWPTSISENVTNHYSCGAANGSGAPGWTKLMDWDTIQYQKRYAKFFANSINRGAVSGVLTVNFMCDNVATVFTSGNVTWESDNSSGSIDPQNFVLLYNSTSKKVELWYNDLAASNQQMVFSLVKEGNRGVSTGEARLYYGVSGSLPSYTSGIVGTYATKQFFKITSDNVKIGLSDTMKGRFYVDSSYYCQVGGFTGTVLAKVRFTKIGNIVTLSFGNDFGTDTTPPIVANGSGIHGTSNSDFITIPIPSIITPDTTGTIGNINNPNASFEQFVPFSMITTTEGVDGKPGYEYCATIKANTNYIKITNVEAAFPTSGDKGWYEQAFATITYTLSLK